MNYFQIGIKAYFLVNFKNIFRLQSVSSLKVVVNDE